MRRVALLVALVMTSAIALLAGVGGAPMVATFLAPTNNVSNLPSPTGVFGDSGGVYSNGVGAVQCYLGAGAGNVDLVTYSTTPSRTLHFVFASPTGSSLPQDFWAQVDFYGVNYYGNYTTMPANSTAQVHGVLQFHYAGHTWQLDYPALAAYRVGSGNTWHISSNTADLPGGPFNPGFSVGSTATLGLERNKGQVIYGNFAMPINFSVSGQ